ncbi:UPF0481 protein At3g47200-like [Euphorbia lathyris]|uniref:UPF0481 protein At3g47200-like n=1 Tax=Euphorbia lathyris TaxID=212925 RepID=UPI003313CEAD
MLSTNEWVIEIKEKLRNMTEPYSVVSHDESEHWKKHSIYKIPDTFTDQNTNAYRPRAVSFGPYYNGEDQLKPMEEHKQRALLHFLRRANKPPELFIECLEQVLQHLKDSYDPLDLCWHQDSDRFIQMMILDGCFMLEIFRWSAYNLDDYATNDPIFSDRGKIYMMPRIMLDMLLLENQLPLLLLHKLISVQTNGQQKDEEDFVNRMILKFCFPCSRAVPNVGKCLHVLDVYRKALVQKHGKKHHHSRIRIHISGGGGGGGGGSDYISWCARELSEGGISFKRSKTASLTDVSFHGRTLRLPELVVDDKTESIFLNLMAFERLHASAGNEMTSYIFFMASLIRSERDVAFLESKGILQNDLGTQKAVAELFNSLGKYLAMDPDNNNLDLVQINVSKSLHYASTKVNAYRKKAGKEFRVKVVGEYCRSPLAILSLIAGIFFVTLTTAQTLYTILPYYHRPSY